MKVCSSCEEPQRATAFHTGKSHCIDCRKIARWAYDAIRKECADNLKFSNMMRKWRTI